MLELEKALLQKTSPVGRKGQEMNNNTLTSTASSVCGCVYLCVDVSVFTCMYATMCVHECVHVNAGA